MRSLRRNRSNIFSRQKGRPAAATTGQALFVGWCGMRGFVTMATAFALPDSFPQRDTVVLTAFCVVLATLVLQGLTLAPLVKLLKLDRSGDATRELASARAAMAKAALLSIAGQDGPEAENLRYRFALKERVCLGETSAASIVTSSAVYPSGVEHGFTRQASGAV